MSLVKQKSGALEIYDPERGLKEIAVSEAAEDYFARAKDLDGLFEAILEKLKAQREYIVWRDSVIKEGRPRKNSRGNAAVLPPGDPGQDVADRWRKSLKEISAFEKTIRESQERCRRICEQEKNVRGTQGTGENEWYTPTKYIEMARLVLGEIDLDPASSDLAQQTVRATKWFTVEQDGLKQKWVGRVWLNPPYAQPFISQFVSKLVAERRDERVSAAIALTHNYTDTAWFHEAMELANAVCFTRGRIKFVGPEGNDCQPTQGQAFIYFGNDAEGFADRFKDIGFVVIPAGEE